MEIKKYLKGHDHIVTKAMIAASIIFGLMILTKTGTAFGQLFKWKNEVKKAAVAIAISPKQTEKNLAAVKTIAEDIKKKNLFAPPPSKAKSIEQVAGIFGDEALINGKWYKAGDKIQDAEIVSIEPTKVIVRVDGQEKSFLPIISKGSGDSEGQKQNAPQTESFRRPDGSSRSDHGPDDRGGFHGPSREDIERYRSMTEEQKQEFRDAMRQRFEKIRESRRNNE